MGIKDGIAEEYRITGELLRREIYREGILHGPKTEWHPNGAKILEVQMKNGKPHGDALEWYPDGTENLPQFTAMVSERALHPNGTLTDSVIRSFYQKDKQHGQRTIWYSDGRKRLTAQFEDDLMEGNSQGGSLMDNNSLIIISNLIWNMEFAQNGILPETKFLKFVLSMDFLFKIYCQERKLNKKIFLRSPLTCRWG